MVLVIVPGVLVRDTCCGMDSDAAIGEVLQPSAHYLGSWVVKWDAWGGTTVWPEHKLVVLTHALSGEPLTRGPVFDWERAEIEELEARCVL